MRGNSLLISKAFKMELFLPNYIHQLLVLVLLCCVRKLETTTELTVSNSVSCSSCFGYFIAHQITTSTYDVNVFLNFPIRQ